MDPIIAVIIAVAAFIVGAAAAGFICFKMGVKHRIKTAEAQFESAEKESARIIEEANVKAEDRKKAALVEAKDEIYKMRSDAEKEISRLKGETDRELKERRGISLRIHRNAAGSPPVQSAVSSRKRKTSTRKPTKWSAMKNSSTRSTRKRTRRSQKPSSSRPSRSKPSSAFPALPPIRQRNTCCHC